MTANGEAQCTAVVLVQDDRFGTFRHQCQSEAGHEGPHRVEYDACEPVAWLSWNGTADGSEA